MASPSSGSFRCCALVVFFCLVYYVLRSSTVENSRGTPTVLPGWVFEKAWQLPKKQAGGHGKLAELQQTLNLIPANLHIVIHLELAVWLTSRPKQHYSRSALRSFLVFSAPLYGSSYSATHPLSNVSLNVPIEFPPSAQNVIACVVLLGKVRCVKGSFNKGRLAWKGQERASGGEPPSDED